jgi:hypothetical protein
LFKQGAHLEGANDTLGICVAGDGDSELWTPAQLFSVLDLCVAWCRHFHWTADVVRGHREGPAYFGGKPTTKTCPGVLVDMNQIRALVAARLAEGAAPSGAKAGL